MNIAVIFAGGQGDRMRLYSRPKQFLEFRNKPVLVYTIERFQYHPEIDAIIVACLKDWIPYIQEQLKKYQLTKVADVVTGGDTGQDSIYNGLEYASKHYPEDSVVLIHDGVRPLIKADAISECIKMTKEKGSCVTCVPSMETPVIKEADGSIMVLARAAVITARAPQCFRLCDVLAVHQRAKEDGIHDFVDTCTMMHHYHQPFHIIMGSFENIKITRPADYFLFRAIEEAREESEVFGTLRGEK